MDRFNHFIAGTAAGIAEIIVGQPLDTVKSRIQAELMKPSNVVHRSEWEIWSDSIRKDGFLQLYRGSSTRIMSAGVGGALLYGVNSSFKKMFHVNAEEDGIASVGFFVAASASGLVETFIYTPFESIKLHMQIAPRDKIPSLQYSTSSIYRKGGISAFYRGFYATAAREISGNIAYFTTYQLLKNNLSRLKGLHPKDASFEIIFFSGGMAGIAFWLVSHPIDTLKSLIQTDNILQPKYNGVIDCIRKVHIEKGILSFYRGFGLSLVRAFPANAVAFST
eukprot:gene6919-14056_t